jgi:trk system potassium uptake protein TrkA
MLSSEEHDIVLMDDSVEKLSIVSNDVDLMTVTGSAHSFHDLKNTGIAKADLFIAVTPFEERNVLACSMASYLGVGRTIARINNSEYLLGRYRAKLDLSREPGCQRNCSFGKTNRYPAVN